MSRVVCRCFNVTEEDIKKAVNKGAMSVEAVYEMTKAGKGCKSCKSDIKFIVTDLLKNKGII